MFARLLLILMSCWVGLGLGCRTTYPPVEPWVGPQASLPALADPVMPDDVRVHVGSRPCGATGRGTQYGTVMVEPGFRQGVWMPRQEIQVVYRGAVVTPLCSEHPTSSDVKSSE